MDRASDIFAPAAAGDRAVPDRRLAYAAIFVVALLPLLSTPLLPFIDFYNHLARYYVLGHLDASPLLRENYASNWALLPNIGLDVLGTALLKILPQRHAAQVIVGLIFAVQYAGLLAFNRALTGRTSLAVALLAVPLLYSFILNWGFANFLLGLGMVFAGAAWWLARRDRPALAVPVASVIAVAIFLTHGLCFALYGLLLGALEIGLWWRTPGRPAMALGVRMAQLVVQAIAPVALFMLGATSHVAGGVTGADDSVARLAAAGALGERLWALFQHRLITIVRVEEGPWLWFDVLTLAAQIGLVAVLIARRRARIAPAAWPALALGCVLVAATPPALFGVGYVADRMPLFLAMLAVGALDVRGAPGRVWTAALAAIVGLRLAAIAWGWQTYARLDAEFEQVAAAIPPGALVNDLLVGGMPRDSDDLRYAMFRPLLIAEHGQAGPLFANESQQPLRLIGPLRRAVAALPPATWGGTMPVGFYDDYLARLGAAGFEYVLIGNASRLTRPLPANAQVVVRTPRLTLLKMR